MPNPVHPRAGDPNAPTDDLARVLPDPPPPRPARRAGAIAAALERFDGGREALTARATAAPRPRARWRTGRTRAAALASAALVALVALPVALEHPNGRLDPPSPPPSATSNDRAVTVPSPQAPPNAELPSPGASPSANAAPPAVAERSRLSAPAVVAPPAPREELAATPVAEAVVPPPPPAPAPPAPPPPTPPPIVAKALADTAGFAHRASSAADGAANIVVTGSRLSPLMTTASRRGGWNACTLADPDRTLRGCERLADSGGRGEKGAGAEVAEGLALGWRDDWAGAIEAFDRALARRPRLGIAYLNRGLARQRLGAADQALADFDRAVRVDPSARSYYARSRARRERGDLRGARADEDRVVDLDPDYARAVDK